MSDIVHGGDLAALEKFMGGVLHQLEPRERRVLFRKVATTIRRSQQKRIIAQRNPDGSKFARRKPPAQPKPANYAVKFLYPSGGSGSPRLVLMKSWTRQGPLLTGFDIEAGGIRSFEWDRVIRFLPVEDADENKGGGKIRQRVSIRRRAMFRRIRRSGILNIGADDHEAWVGFAGRVAAVARVHQFGLRDKPSRTAREVAYARRELLGLTAQDREDLIDAVLEHLTAMD
jgi:phage gpG-like protein